MDSLEFLEQVDTAEVQPVFVLAGDEQFLKRQVLAVVRRLVLGAEDGDLGLARFAGEKASRAAVLGELQTLPFLCPRRLVVIEDADPFVTRERAWLEKYVAAPAASGVLAIDVQSWPSNTRLAKTLAGAATVHCVAPKAAQLPGWCRGRCKTAYGKDLTTAAARTLVDLVGAEMGILDQEMAKLADYVGTAPRIDEADVDTLVGNSREEKTWKVFELIGAGQNAEALVLLDRLFEQGDDPFQILGAFSHSLRGLARAARAHARGVPLGAALGQSGIPPFAHHTAEAQMRRLGRRRLDRLYDWLLQIDLDFKGFSQLPRRTLLERLVVRLARPADANPARSD